MNTLDTIWSLLLDFFRILNMNCIHKTGYLMTWKYFMQMQEAVTVFEDFAIKIKNITKDGREDVKTLQKSIFKVAQAVEKFALNYGKRHLSGMRSSEKIVLSKMGENQNPSNCETFLLTLFIETFLK